MKDISAYQQADFLDLAYFAYKREAAGKPVKSQEIWKISNTKTNVGIALARSVRLHDAKKSRCN